jgi:hypothetical protein
MGHDRFDGLTRALANSMSRRQALKLLGGSIVGAMFAAFGGSTAQAARPNRSYCLTLCKNVEVQFRGQCMSTCMPCNFDTSSLCSVSGPGFFDIACCPQPLICSASITAVCVPPES